MVYFESPKNLEEITESKQVTLKGIIQNNEGIEHVAINVISPDNKIVYVVINEKVSTTTFPFEHVFSFETSQFQVGQYTLQVSVDTKHKDLVFNRKFSYKPDEANSSNGKYSVWVNQNTLMHFNSNGEKLFDKIFYSNYSQSISQKGALYSYNTSKGILRIANDSTHNGNVIVPKSSISVFESFNVLDESNFLVAMEENNRFKLVNYKNGQRISEINNATFRLKKACAIDEFIFSLDLRDGTNSDFHMSHYNRSTGSKLGSQPIQAFELVDIFHFGDANKVYALVHGKTGNNSKIFRYNKSRNSVSELFTVSGRALKTDVIKLGSGKILFATQNNIYTFSADDNAPTRVLINFSGSILSMNSTSSSMEFGFLHENSGKKTISFFDKSSLEITQENPVPNGSSGFHFIAD